MRDSVTYQAILDEGRIEGQAKGRAEGERRLILLVGSSRFGEPDDAIQSRLEAVTEIDALEQLARRLLTAASWDELLTDQA